MEQCVRLVATLIQALMRVSLGHWLHGLFSGEVGGSAFRAQNPDTGRGPLGARPLHWAGSPTSPARLQGRDNPRHLPQKNKTKQTNENVFPMCVFKCDPG